MTAFVPSGYISVREALNRLGRELFPSNWTGEEHKARRGLISEDEWLRIKDLPPASGGDAGRYEKAPAASPTPTSISNPSDPSYQEEYSASKRLAAARRQLRVGLESGHLEAAVLDPWTGVLHQASASLWRRHNADRMIEKGEAPIPHSRNTGSLWVKRFAEANVCNPMPEAKIKEAIEVLREKIATERLTRPQQRDFLRKHYPNYHVTERQLEEVFRAVPIPTGRPKKSGEKD
jgi:hypothetical protein